MQHDNNKPWDNFFKKHISKASEQNIELNDSVDSEWIGSQIWGEKFIQPYLTNTNHTICEIGPGSGRFTRYYLPDAKKYYLVDYSEFVCNLLQEEFNNYNNKVIIKSSNCDLSQIEDNECDLVFSLGVFVHLYLEQIYGYYKEFSRIMKPGGFCVIHFANFMTDGGYDWFNKQLPANNQFDKRSLFRFYHPEMIDKIASIVGLKVYDKHIIDKTRHCILVCTKE